MNSSTSTLVVIRDQDTPVVGGEVVAWALEQLSNRVERRGFVYQLRSDPPPAGSTVVVRLSSADGDDLPAEAFRVEAGADGENARIVAGDERGFMYALLELGQSVDHGASPEQAVSAMIGLSETPAVPMRALTRTFSCVDEDPAWFHDRKFWTEYLSWLAASRFNRFHLAFGMQYNYGTTDPVGDVDNYLCFTYPFLFDVDGYEVAVKGVDRAEQERNYETLKFIARETKRRGMQFQLGLWNHAYDYGEKAVERYPISGLTPENHADYCAAALAKLLDECPEIGGLTFRVHYEGGIPDLDHEIFWDKVFAGASSVGRPLDIDMHAKGVDQALIDAVNKPHLRPVLSAKYWAEHYGLPYHQASIRPLEFAAPAEPGDAMRGITHYGRRFTRYGYGDFLSEDRETGLIFRVWPGTHRFLLWGDPEIAAGYGRLSTFGGSEGVDYCEPLLFKGRKGTGQPGGHDPYLHPDLALGVDDWKKYKYTYLLWGRLLYNPDADPETWRGHLRSAYGRSAAQVEKALAPLSRILPLVTVVHGLSASNNRYWPELYYNLPISSQIASPHYEGDTASPANWGTVCSFDPTMFYGINEYVDDLIAGSLSARYTPEEVAGWLEDLVNEADEQVSELRAHPTADPQYRRMLIDCEVLLCLGSFFAGKFRSAIEYAGYQATGDTALLASAVARHRVARDAFAKIITVVDGVYRPNLTFGHRPGEHGHWSDRLPEIDRDLDAMITELAEAQNGAATSGRFLPSAPARPAAAGISHRPPSSYDRGAALDLGVDVIDDAVTGATLHYRHVDQSESFQETPLQQVNGKWQGTIPGEYTASSFPLMYFFSVERAGQRPTLYPGLSRNLSDQPYLLLYSSAHKS